MGWGGVGWGPPGRRLQVWARSNGSCRSPGHHLCKSAGSPWGVGQCSGFGNFGLPSQCAELLPICRPRRDPASPVLAPSMASLTKAAIPRLGRPRAVPRSKSQKVTKVHGNKTQGKVPASSDTSSRFCCVSEAAPWHDSNAGNGRCSDLSQDTASLLSF